MFRVTLELRGVGARSWKEGGGHPEGSKGEGSRDTSHQYKEEIDDSTKTAKSIEQT